MPVGVGVRAPVHLAEALYQKRKQAVFPSMEIQETGATGTGLINSHTGNSIWRNGLTFIYFCFSFSYSKRTDLE